MSVVQVEKVITLTGHKDSIYSLESASNDVFFSTGADGMVVRWDARNEDKGTLIAKLENSSYALHFIPQTHFLLIGENFYGVRLIDILAKKEILSSRLTSSYIFDIKSIDNLIYVACGDGELIVLNKGDLSILTRLKLSEKSARTITLNILFGLLAVGYSDNDIRIISLKKNKVVHTINAHQNSIFTLQFSPDGRYLISGSRDAHFKVWDCNDNFKLHTSVVAHMYAINHISYAPSGKIFATCSMDKSIKIWDAEKFSLLKVIDKARHAGHGTSVNKLLWQNNQSLISASDDRSIAIWNLLISL